MSVITRFQNRRSRIVVSYPPEENRKDSIFIKRSYRDTIEFFDAMIPKHKEVFRLECYVDEEWILQEEKRLLPKKQLILKE